MAEEGQASGTPNSIIQFDFSFFTCYRSHPRNTGGVRNNTETRQNRHARGSAFARVWFTHNRTLRNSNTSLRTRAYSVFPGIRSLCPRRKLSPGETRRAAWACVTGMPCDGFALRFTQSCARHPSAVPSEAHDDSRFICRLLFPYWEVRFIHARKRYARACEGCFQCLFPTLFTSSLYPFSTATEGKRDSLYHGKKRDSTRVCTFY